KTELTLGTPQGGNVVARVRKGAVAAKRFFVSRQRVLVSCTLGECVCPAKRGPIIIRLQFQRYAALLQCLIVFVSFAEAVCPIVAEAYSLGDVLIGCRPI